MSKETNKIRGKNNISNYIIQYMLSKLYKTSYKIQVKYTSCIIQIILFKLYFPL